MHDDTYYRDRILELEAQLDSLDNPSGGSISCLVQTVTVATYPTAAASFFAVQPLGIDGLEAEGATAVFIPDPARVFYAYNIGAQTPPAGTELVATSVGGRWTVCYGGNGS